jgi:Xaa-Pro aminopeptidase
MVTSRHAYLKEAQTKAEQLFFQIESRELLKPGMTEKQLNQQVFQLAFEMFGIKKYWHKRIVRCGKNTLCPYKENPPELTLQEDDIVFFDLGPVFEDWEADFGRTFVIGSDPIKLTLKHQIEQAWQEGKDFFLSRPDITGAELYAHVSNLAKKYEWIYGQEHCGHLIGNFPHELIQGDEIVNYIHPENHTKMRDPDSNGNPRDWILEIHFIDQEMQIGGFFEQLLTVEYP